MHITFQVRVQLTSILIMACEIKSNLLSVVKMVVFHLWIAVYFQVPLLDFGPSAHTLFLTSYHYLDILSLGLSHYWGWEIASSEYRWQESPKLLVQFILLIASSPFNWWKRRSLKVLVTQSYLTLCDPIDCSWPGFSVHRILQQIILEPIAILFSMGSSQLSDWTQVSYTAGSFFTIWATREVLEIFTYQ